MWLYICFQSPDGNIESENRPSTPSSLGDNRSTNIDIQKQLSPLAVEVMPSDGRGKILSLHRVCLFYTSALAVATHARNEGSNPISLQGNYRTYSDITGTKSVVFSGQFAQVQ